MLDARRSVNLEGVSSRYRPQLATLSAKPPAGPEWVHEVKFDGYRMGVLREGGSVQIESRNGVDFTSKLPELSTAVKRLPCSSALIDGEIAILQADGRTSFQRLQNVFRAGAAREGLVYYAFDLLELEGRSLAGATLLERKALLAELVRSGPDLIRFSQHVEADGATVLAQVAALGGEGIVSKRRDARHRAGRSDGWLKTKCTQHGEFVIGGFTEPEGSRSGIGALLLGVYQDEKFVFCGGVGTGQGWTADFLLELRRGLDTLLAGECPFVEPPPPEVTRAPRWVRPLLVCKVAFAEWSDEGSLRHPSFQGFVPGRAATEVTRQG